MIDVNEAGSSSSCDRSPLNNNMVVHVSVLLAYVVTRF